MASRELPAAFGAGRYAVRRLIGEGGDKRVYLVHDARLDRDVALAVLKTDGLDQTSLARVRREARAMGRLGDHPHVVTVHDIGDEHDRPFIVSQYMPGGSIEDLLRCADGHRLPIEQAVVLADQICRALEHAHGHQVVHRDLKPSNVWLTADGTAKLGDFGLAAVVDRSRLTLEGAMIGTIAYMAPEQALGRPADARSDLYALGALLYEMLTGRPPFLGDDAVAVISQHINTPPVAPSWHNPDVPRTLEALVLRLLAKAPEDRPESAAAVRRALASIRTPGIPPPAPAPEDVPNPLDRLAGGVFVGRESEMELLRAAVDEALSGRGRLLLLLGEPGIGKTRTAEELATYARLRKFQVLWGRCYEGGGAPAYWPWVQAIRSYVHEHDHETLLAQMGSGVGDIAQVVSDVRERLPGLPTSPVLEPDHARFRLFDSVTTFLRNAANAAPVMLVLDDLHWADKPSLLLLEFLAHGMRGARLLVIGTYRDAELGRQHPLSRTLGELARQQQSERVTLGGLTHQHVARFIELTAGVRPPESLVAAVSRETEGNPFFVNEVVRLLVTERRLERPEGMRSPSVDIPQSIREVVGRRLDRLSAECNEVLTTAAVIGREFGLDTLERAGGPSGDALLDVLEEALGARVIVEVPRQPGRYAFAHALIRETLYGALTATRRARTHRRIGDILEELHLAHIEPHLAEVAYHLLAGAVTGNDVPRAVDYARRAGDRAAALLAHEEAANHYGRALETLERTDPVAETKRCALLLALGEAQARAGDTAEAKTTLQHAAQSARALGSPHDLARAALARTGLHIDLFVGAPGGLDDDAIALLEEALAALPAGDTALRATLLARLAAALYWSEGSFERRDALSREAVEIAERMGDDGILATVLTMRRAALFDPDTLEERLAVATRILALAEKAGNEEARLAAHLSRISDLLELGDVRGADREVDAHEELARKLRQPRYIGYATVFRALRALMDGRFEAGEALARQALDTAQRLGSHNLGVLFATQMFWLRREQGRLQDLEVATGGIVEHTGALPAVRCGMALTMCEIGLVEEARAQFDELAAGDFACMRRDVAWFPAMIALVEVCAALGNAHRAAVLYRLLAPYGRRNVVVGTPAAFCWGPASYYLGRLAATMGERDDAAAHLEDALARSEAMGARPFVAHAAAEYGALLLACGERRRGLTLVNRALDVGRALGMKPLVERMLGEKLRAQGVDSGDLKTSLYAVASAVQRDPPDLARHAAPDGTVTILFTDIEGSTALTERLGDRRAHDILRAHNLLVRQAVAEHGGVEVKSEGDGFMLAFQSARRALACAVALQRGLRAWGTDHPDEAVRVRIGIHTGEVLREADDFFGLNVIVAARIADQARGGEVLVSGLVKRLVDNMREFRFDGGRQVSLKGLTGPHEIFRLEW
jgi:class 3 adenylate cyclase